MLLHQEIFFNFASSNYKNMLNLKFIQDYPEVVIEKLKKRNFDASEIVGEIVDSYRKKNEAQQRYEQARAELNKISGEIGLFFRQGKKEEAEAARTKTTELKENLKQFEKQFQEIEQKVSELQVLLPNLPHDLVPAGKDADDNEIVKTGGEMPQLEENAMPHWELIQKYNLADFELGVKITGAGFPIYRGKGARLQRALINFFLDENRKAGYEEIQPPLLVNEDSGFGTGQLPDKEGQMYHVTGDNLYLIATLEVPATYIYRDIILATGVFPI